MSASLYFSKITQMIEALGEKSLPSIQKAAGFMADSIAADRAVYYFGSGHSVLPALDVFPRYGSFVGLQPIHDTRLMWSNVIGPGGTPELLWLERQEGYIKNVFNSYVMDSRDTLIVVSHGGAISWMLAHLLTPETNSWPTWSLPNASVSEVRIADGRAVAARIGAIAD
jgi:uncharacterized phosphosugar-binding protein